MSGQTRSLLPWSSLSSNRHLPNRPFRPTCLTSRLARMNPLSRRLNNPQSIVRLADRRPLLFPSNNPWYRLGPKPVLPRSRRDKRFVGIVRPPRRLRELNRSEEPRSEWLRLWKMVRSSRFPRMSFPMPAFPDQGACPPKRSSDVARRVRFRPMSRRPEAVPFRHPISSRATGRMEGSHVRVIGRPTIPILIRVRPRSRALHPRDSSRPMAHLLPQKDRWVETRRAMLRSKSSSVRTRRQSVRGRQRALPKRIVPVASNNVARSLSKTAALKRPNALSS